MEKTCHPRLGGASLGRRGSSEYQALFLFCRMMRNLQLSDQIEEFVSGSFVFKENSAEGRCGCDCIGLLHTSEGHACVGSFNDHSYTKRVESFLYAVADLCGEPFLYLKTACECFHNSCYLAQTGDGAVRDVCNMGFADERHYMMLACRIQFDVLDQNHLLILFLEHGTAQNLRTVLHAAVGQELQCLGNPFRCLYQAFTLWIFSQKSEYFPVVICNCLGSCLIVYLLLDVCHDKIVSNGVIIYLVCSSMSFKMNEVV